MTNDNDAKAGTSKLDLSVLQGLVTVSQDKTKLSDGRVSGPLTVTVFGIPVFIGSGAAPRHQPNHAGHQASLSQNLQNHQEELKSRLLNRTATSA